MKPLIISSSLVVCLCFCISLTAFSQESSQAHDYNKGQDHNHEHNTLHFSHPIATESPFPDTKFRFDYVFESLSENEGNQQTIHLEGEYAFSRHFSLEVDVPYSFISAQEEATISNLSSVEVGLKYANFALEKKGILLGGGMEFGLPTGNDNKDIGSATVWELEPFLDFGWIKNNLEIVSFLTFGIAVNGDSDEADWELGWNLSTLYHITPSIELLLESAAEKVYGGEEDGFNTVSLIPGVKWMPKGQEHFKAGFSTGIPISSEKEVDMTAFFSLFYHF